MNKDFWMNQYASSFKEEEEKKRDEILDFGNIVIRTGDITTIEADAIVNPANGTLLGGSGLDGLIHQKAGRSLREECAKLGGCKTGEAKITNSYNLSNCSYIIHTVGPQYAYEENPEKLLKNCYQNCLNIAIEKELHSIAFPCISTGAYGYPFEPAGRIAIRTVKDFQKEHNLRVIFVCREDYEWSAYFKIYNQILREGEV